MRGLRRQGFTLVEVLIAVVMLGIVTLALMSTTNRMIRHVSDDRVETVAVAAAEARTAQIRQWPSYTTLDSAFAGTETDTPLPGWTRTTTMVRITSQSNDFRRITVRVTGPGMPAPVSRSISIAAP
jgi:prepilin-type N-terminal cleavage/methylation domain-containing protein